MQCSQNQWPAVTGFEPLHGEPTQSLLLLSLPNAFAPNIEGKKKKKKSFLCYTGSKKIFWDGWINLQRI